MFLHLYQNNEDNKEHLAIVFGNGIRSQSLDRPREGETEMDRLIRGAYTGRLYPGRTTSRMPESSSKNGNGKLAAAPAVPGEEKKLEPVMVRIHSECYTGETVWSARCDCGEQLDEAARLMSLPGSGGGIIIYLRQEGRGIGLGEKLKAYNLQDLGSDTVQANLLLRHPADARSYGLATAMLEDLGQKEIKLLTNNPDKVRAVEGPNREIVVKERVPMIPLAWRGKTGGIRSEEVGGYLKTKVCYLARLSGLKYLLTNFLDRKDGTHVRNGGLKIYLLGNRRSHDIDLLYCIFRSYQDRFGGLYIRNKRISHVPKHISIHYGAISKDTNLGGNSSNEVNFTIYNYPLFRFVSSIYRTFCCWASYQYLLSSPGKPHKW